MFTCNSRWQWAGHNTLLLADVNRLTECKMPNSASETSQNANNKSSWTQHMLPWHWSLRHECWRIPEMSNIFARMTITVPEIQDNLSSVIFVTCPIQLLDEVTQLVCNGRSYVRTRPTENSKIFWAKNTTTEKQHFRYSNSYVVETSGYTTWFTARGAIRIAHYDVIDDVKTRKL